MSTMFSNMADSSKAGFMVADSTKSSALVEMSANLRNHWIFSRIWSLLRSMVSLVSISYAHRFGAPSTGVCVPSTSWPSRLVRLCTGLVEASMVRRPCCACHSAVEAAKTVLPTPPLPPKKTYFSPAWSLRYCRIDFSIPGMAVLSVECGRAALPVHDAGELLDHRQAG